MREKTAEWLNPMLDEAEKREMRFAELQELMMQATFPASEACTPFANALAKEEDLRDVRTIDWIEFGRLLRKKLRWHDYPESP
jgi:hypothetical protein